MSQPMRAERVTQEEVLAAMRSRGIPRIEDVEAVVLKIDGSFMTPRRTEQFATSPQTVSNIPAE